MIVLSLTLALMLQAPGAEQAPLASAAAPVADLCLTNACSRRDEPRATGSAADLAAAIAAGDWVAVLQKAGTMEQVRGALMLRIANDVTSPERRRELEAQIGGETTALIPASGDRIGVVVVTDGMPVSMIEAGTNLNIPPPRARPAG